MGRHVKLSSRIMMICPPYPSHWQAFAALAEELRLRGHHVGYLCGETVRDTPIPPSSSCGGRGLRRDILAGAARTEAFCRSGPSAISDYRPDLIVGDQTEPAAGLLSGHLGIPMVSVACALPFDPEPGIPLPFLGWSPDRSERGVRRLESARRISQWVMAPQTRVIGTYAKAWNLGPLRDFPDCISPMVTLAQTAPGFDYPRPVGNHRVKHTGPFRAPSTEHFPNDICLDRDRPFVYVSLGTLQGHRVALLSRIARACRRAGVQVLVAHGGRLSPDQARRIPANWVRAFVPQRAVLKKAQLCVTHAGLNTAMECLEQGVPMLALPLTNDQPGVAARIEEHGFGLRLTAAFATEGRLLSALLRLLSEDRFRDNCSRFSRTAPFWRRAAGAVDIIETFLPHLRGQTSAGRTASATLPEFCNQTTSPL